MWHIVWVFLRILLKGVVLVKNTPFYNWSSNRPIDVLSIN